jgi:Tol biopolymer transport system component
MNDRPDLLERYAPLFAPPRQPFDGLLRRRDRKRRNRRIAAGAIGLAVGLTTILVGTSLTRTAPAPSTPTPAPSQSSAPSPTPSTTVTQPPTGELPPLLHPGEALQVTDAGLVALPPEGGIQRVLVDCKLPCKDIFDPAISADGRWVVYVKWMCHRGHQCESGGLWYANALEKRQLISPCDAGQECFFAHWVWSRVGATLAIVNVGDQSEVLTFDPVSGGFAFIARPEQEVSKLVWAPDGRLVYVAGALTIVDPGTGDLSVIADGVGEVENIAWSPDGTRIAYDAFLHDRNQIVVVGVDGSNPTVLVDQEEPEGPGAPAWSPDGTRIAYVNTPQKEGVNGGHFSFEVWVIGADGSNRTRLFHGRCCIGDWRAPRWSPDGSRIAFFDDVDTDYGTYLVVDSDGSGEVSTIPEAEALGW